MGIPDPLLVAAREETRGFTSMPRAELIRGEDERIPGLDERLERRLALAV
jgi:hypothetical protein